MSEQDRVRWDARHAMSAADPESGLPPVFAAHVAEFPVTGSALDIACGQGAVSIWLAQHGLHVLGVDVSPVAIATARNEARRLGVADRCRFDVVDLDDGLPAGPPVDVIFCHRFRDARLDRALVDRLAPGGLLAISVLSEVGGAPGPFRARPGELTAAFADLEVIAAGEGDGEAWLVATVANRQAS
ncbi:class I SAM-dependent methyltransferase [Mycolicibacterium brisbanense]|uniref:Thiopurine S-methyltransferase n=1 Tax=Mycolicibacterium brisbanense TaxID=146020 RepID=A0A100VU65_9MYCO|nr:class I SAM-dependent methyltransferase [Mycolicibacterium brisbanense]MCV7157028.1 methyltransferase domain-containing protein [Mycolicibacterium brisbanense]GAS86108.1 thiopurine S-methyltransferase [Mycolicibacterium brisbanense]